MNYEIYDKVILSEEGCLLKSLAISKAKEVNKKVLIANLQTEAKFSCRENEQYSKLGQLYARGKKKIVAKMEYSLEEMEYFDVLNMSSFTVKKKLSDKEALSIFVEFALRFKEYGFFLIIVDEQDPIYFKLYDQINDAIMAAYAELQLRQKGMKLS